MRTHSARSDLVAIFVIFVLVLILSYDFNVFIFIVDLFRKYPHAVTYIDEIIMGLLTLSVSFAVFAWRRLAELKIEAEKCIRAEKELADMADSRAATERIISKQLHAEIEVLLNYLKAEKHEHHGDQKRPAAPRGQKAG